MLQCSMHNVLQCIKYTINSLCIMHMIQRILLAERLKLNRRNSMSNFNKNLMQKINAANEMHRLKFKE